MAQTSRRLRQLRKLKRERSLALRMVTHVAKERNVLRQLLIEEKIRQIKEESKVQITPKAEVEARSPVLEGEVLVPNV